MSIKIKYRDPKTTDFTKNDIVNNQKDGNLFYKSELGLHKLPEHYFLQSFNNDWDEDGGYYGNQRYISWTGTLPQTNLNKVSNHLLIPFKGTLHKLFFKQTGDNFSTTIKVWINDFANEVFQKTHINNPGDGTNFGNMNEIDINLDVNIGDTVLVALDAQQAPGIKLITGHLLYSQIINT